MSLLERRLRAFMIRREREARDVLGMSRFHPELLAGAEKAAVKPDFVAWTGDLMESGQTSGHIIADEMRRRGL